MEAMGRPVAVVAEAPPKIWRRETRGGRTLEYELKVIQQPERARACGSGAKSSADRRPVDPPPVVELRIHDLNGNGPLGKEDVTFSYEANFFLFATLEVARQIAHHRGQPQPPSQQVPVLTGMPVSGMAYLDRPKEAGYFIFPDLSVRHEGKYRLSFNLYEETKKLEDTDKEVSADGTKAAGGASPDASFDWRMEVKSDPFTVFSAKKFPGLAESTNLSRTVAEQGCRVRIRRDVRMRRREGKGNGEYDEVPEEEFRGRPAEPEPYIRERTRSSSAGSEEGRPAHQDPNQPYQQSSYAPSAGSSHAPPPRGGHLNFGSQDQFAPPQHPQFAAPAPPAAAAPPTYYAAQSPYAPSGAPAPPSYASAYRAQQPQPPSNHYQQHERQYPQSAHPSHPPRETRDVFEPDRRASFASYAPAAPQQAPYYPPADVHHGQHPPHGFAPHLNDTTQTRLPPLKMPGDAKYENMSASPGPLSSIRSIAPPVASPVHERGQEHPGFYNHHYTAPQPLPEPARNGGKRPFGNAFNTTSTSEPLFNGMRPSSPHEQAETEEDMLSILGKMEYRRADGSKIERNLPHVNGASGL